jgi:hypothetical protein
VAIVVLIASGVALAARPSIRLTGPHTIAKGSAATFRASGYFTASKAHPYNRPNFAEVMRLRGTLDPTTSKVCEKHGQYVAGGVSEKKWRAKTPTTPGHFSVKFKAKASKAGDFTLCGVMGNYPVGGIEKRPLTVLHYSVP